MKIVSLITARGGSKGIPQKNLRFLNGKPLVSYSITASEDSDVDETWVSTEDENIKIVSMNYGAKVIDRPLELADDIIMPDASIVHFAENVSFDLVVFMHPTSPLIKPEYINKAIDMMKSGKYDSVFSGTLEHWIPRWNLAVEPVDWDIQKRPRRQDMPSTYIENGMLYVAKREDILKNKLRYGGKIGVVEIPIKDSFQVDSPDDLDLVEKLIKIGV